MTDFKRTQIRSIPKSEDELTEDNLYWKKLQFPVTVKEYGPVTSINFCKEKPYYFAVTSTSKVQVYNPATNEAFRKFTRFQEAAHGGILRNDGKLLLAGGDEGHLKLFDVDAKSMLRVFKGHKGSIHKCNFMADGTKVVSFSDDKSVVLWDVASENKIVSFQEHQDYVRAGTVSHINQDLIVSGSYDHSVKLYDIRTNTGVLSLNHGDPVESVIMFPSASVIVSAGGNIVKVWDILGSGKLLAVVSNHHKTVTSLCLASNNQRLLTASLDRHVKIHDVSSFKVVHSLNYSSPILSVDISATDKTLVVGMADGIFSIQHRKEKSDKTKNHNTKKTSYNYMLNQSNTQYKPSEGDVIVEHNPMKKLSNYDKYLKSFQTSKTLDAVLKDYFRSSRPNVTISVIQELIRRGTIRSALAGRDKSSLLRIMKFVNKHINDPRFSRILVDVADMLLDIYGAELGQSREIDAQFSKLRDVTNREMNFMQEIMILQGFIEPFLAMNSNSEEILSSTAHTNIIPSKTAS